MYIDIKSIKLFDCLQCLIFPSMRENDKIRSISCSNYFVHFVADVRTTNTALTRLINVL